jgi:hypothetical protein
MRQMGEMYLYSFDISVLLFGVCFNLSGLPYSAGFLGKEFLLFQVLRDDYTSLIVRSCWLVSFFFTPIYMFILVFLVMFDVKKGYIIAYKSVRHFNPIANSYSLFKLFKTKYIYKNLTLNFTYSSLFKFSFTSVTSISTSYMLFSFWVFFLFFGESLLLVVFN